MSNPLSIDTNLEYDDVNVDAAVDGPCDSDSDTVESEVGAMNFNRTSTSDNEYESNTGTSDTTTTDQAQVKEYSVNDFLDDSRSIVHSLATHASEPGLCKDACRALWRLVVQESEKSEGLERSRLLDNHTVEHEMLLPTLLKVMWTQLYNKSVVEAAVGILATFARNQHNRHSLRYASCVLATSATTESSKKEYKIEDLVLSAMHVHKRRVGIQIKCCSVIRNTLSESTEEDKTEHNSDSFESISMPTMTERWVLKSAPKLLLDAILTHPHSAELHVRACGALAVVAQQSATGRNALVENGAIGVLRSLLDSLNQNLSRSTSPVSNGSQVENPLERKVANQTGVPVERQVTPTAKSWKSWAGSFLDRSYSPRSRSSTPRGSNSLTLENSRRSIVNVVLCTAWNLAQCETFRLEIAMELLTTDALLNRANVQAADTELFLGMLWNLTVACEPQGNICDCLLRKEVVDAMKEMCSKATISWPSRKQRNETQLQCTVVVSRLILNSKLTLENVEPASSALMLVFDLMKENPSQFDLQEQGMYVLSYLLELGCQIYERKSQEVSEEEHSKASLYLDTLLQVLIDCGTFSRIASVLNEAEKGDTTNNFRELVPSALTNLVKFSLLNPTSTASISLSKDCAPLDEPLLAVVTRLMRKFQLNSTIQARGCSYVWSVRSNCDIVAETGQEGTTIPFGRDPLHGQLSRQYEQVAILALRNHLSDVDVCSNALGSLWVLAARNDSSRQRLVASESSMIPLGVELVTTWSGLVTECVGGESGASCQLHECEEILAQTMSLLWWLSSTAGGAKRLNALDVVGTITSDIDRVHKLVSKDARLRLTAAYFGMLQNVLVGDTSKPCSPKHNNCNPSLQVLERVSRYVSICLQGEGLASVVDNSHELSRTVIIVLNSLSRYPNILEVITNWGVLKGITSSLATFPHDEVLVSNCLSMLWKLLSSRAGVQLATDKAFVTDTRKVVTQKVMVLHREKPTLQRLAIRLLSVLSALEVKHESDQVSSGIAKCAMVQSDEPEADPNPIC